MEAPGAKIGHLAANSKEFARRLMKMGETRLELLLVEVQELFEGLLRAILLALGVATLGLLAGVALTASVVVLFWEYSPLAVLLSLASLYAAGAIWLYRRLTLLLRDWQTLSATLDQLRKDRAGLEKLLA